MPAGRPAIMNAEKEDRVVQALRMGFSYKTCAALAECSADTLRVYRINNPEFSARCTRERAEGKRTVVAKLIQNVRNGDQRAIEFYCKTRIEEFWPDKQIEEDDTGQQMRKDIEAMGASIPEFEATE